MGKPKGRQRDTAFTVFGDDAFKKRFYDHRHTFDSASRDRIEREAKARGIRNARKRAK